MTTDEILDDVVQREGGFKNDPEDPADPTNFGITAAVAGDWLQLGRRATAVEMQTLITAEVAKEIYQKRYVEDPGFTPENVPFEPLRVQLIDFGINSGPATATRWLQRVVRVTPSGNLSSVIPLLRDLHANPTQANILAEELINDALVAARSYMIDRLVDTGKLHAKYEEGVESRALGFFLAKP